MAGGAARNIAVIVTASTGNFRSTMYAAARDLERFGQAGSKTSSGFSRAMSMIGAAAKIGLVALAVGLGAAVVQATKFEAVMQNVGTNTSASQRQIDGLSKSVIGLSRDVPKSAQDLAEGLYFITSSGFEAGGAMKVLDASARTATAGLATTEDTAHAITGVLNAYGKGAEDAAWAGDVLFQGVKLGVMTMTDLTHITGRYVGTAASLGVSLEDSTAAISTMTLQSLSAAESATSLNGIFRAFLKPNAELQKAMRETGLSIKDLSDPSIGLHGVMKKLGEYTGGDATKMRALFNEIRAGRGAMLLINNDGKLYQKIFDGMAKSTGSVATAMEIQMKGFGMQLDLGMNRLKAFGLEVGLFLIPILTDIFASAARGASIAWDAIQSLGKALTPTGHALTEIGRDIGEFFQNAGDVIKPVAQLLVGGFIVGLNAITTTFSTLFGLFAHNKAVVQVVVTALMALAIGSAVVAGITAAGNALIFLQTAMVSAGNASVFLGAAQQAMVGLKLMAAGAAQAMQGMVTGIPQIRSGFGQVASAIATPQVALAIFAAGVIVWMKGVNQAHAQAKAQIEDLSQDVNHKSLRSLEQWQDRLSGAEKAATKTSDATRGLGGGLKFLAEMATPMKNSVLDARVATEDLGKAADDAQKEYVKLYDNFTDISRKVSQSNPLEAGAGSIQMTVEQVEKWVNKLNKLGYDTGSMSNKEIAGAIQEVSSLAASGSPSLEAYSTAMADMGDEAATATDKINALKAAFDALIGAPLAVFDATTKMQDALSTLNTDAKAGGTDLDVMSEAGRKLRDDFSGAIQSAVDLADAVGNVDGEAAGMASLKSSAKNLYDLAAAAGIGKDKLDGLFQDFNIDPDSLSTEFMVGADTTQADKNIKESKDKAKQGKTELLLSTDEAKEAVSGLMGSLKAYQKSNPKTFAKLNIDDPTKNMAQVMQGVEFYANSNPKTKAYLDSLDPETKSAVLASIAERWRNESPTTTAYLAGVEEAEARLAYLSRARTVQIRAMISGGAAPGQVNAEIMNRRWGGVTHMAAGGTKSRQAMIGAGRGMTHWDEPSTGGEGYVPRKGDPARSFGIMQEMAGWYGWDVVKPGKGVGQYGGGTRPVDPRSFAPQTGPAISGGTSVVYQPKVEVTFTGAINGVEDLRKEVGKVVASAISDNWDGVAKVIKRKEMVGQ